MNDAGSVNTCVVVGANMTGGRAVEALRRAGFQGRVVLIGEEPERPYNRPPLSKEFLLEDYPEEKLYYRPPEYYEEQQIELRLGVRATRLDAEGRVVELESGERIPFDRLLIATGASVRRLNVPGADLDGIHYLRTVRDAKRIQAELQSGRRVVIVGAGFIGAEIAASCRQRGLEVTMVEILQAPLQQALGEEVGRICGEFHRGQGVHLVMGEGVQAFRGNERVHHVVTASGREIPCDFVVVGIGVVPETRWLADSGVQLENGVVVDEYCETNIPGIFAAGDIANWWHPRLGERLRVEHETNAQNQGMVAAQNMLGQRTVYDTVPYVWSDQYDLHLQYVGHATHWDQVVIRGSVDSRAFTVFYLVGSQVRAALTVNRPRDLTPLRQLIQAQATATVEQLADEQVDLRSLLAKSS